MADRPSDSSQVCQQRQQRSADLPEVPETSPGAGTAPSFKRGRGRPPKAQKKRLIRAKARTRKKETPTNVETETAIQAETKLLELQRR